MNGRGEPREPDIGPPWFKRWCRDVIARIESIKPTAGTGVFISESPRGRSIHAAPGGQGGAAAAPRPWDLTITDDTDLTIHPGSINNFIPSNMFDTFTVGSGLYYVKVVCATDGWIITSAALVVNTSPPSSQTPTNSALPTDFEFTVGVVIDGEGFNSSQKLLTATGSRLFLADKASPAGPGEMAFEEWLVWAIA